MNGRFLLFVFVWMSLMPMGLRAQDTIMLHSVEIIGEKESVETIKPLVARKLDTLVLLSKSTSSLSELLIQHSPVFIKT